MRAAWLLIVSPGVALAHPGHEDRGLILAFLDHAVSDTPSLVAAGLCVAAALLAGLRKRKAKK